MLYNFSRKDIGKVTVGCDQERIRIYTFGGTQIGLAGVGQGEEALTFPAHAEPGMPLGMYGTVVHAVARVVNDELDELDELDESK